MAEFKDQAKLLRVEDADKKREEWKTKNAVPFKALAREIETRGTVEPVKREVRVRTGKTMQQELRHEHASRVEKAREHVPGKHKPPERDVKPPQRGKVHFKDLEDVRARRRDDDKGTSLRSKFKANERPARDEPPTMSNEEHCELRGSRAQNAQQNIPDEHKPKSGGLSSKMSSAFNDQVDADDFPETEIDDPDLDIGFE